MKLVFQENPKFGDEQDVTQQIIAIDEHIEKLLAEIKRFEVRTKWTADQVSLSLSVLSSHTSPRSSEREYLNLPITIRPLNYE
jgi:hypothetical protein